MFRTSNSTLGSTATEYKRWLPCDVSSAVARPSWCLPTYVPRAAATERAIQRLQISHGYANSDIGTPKTDCWPGGTSTLDTRVGDTTQRITEGAPTLRRGRSGRTYLGQRHRLPYSSCTSLQAARHYTRSDLDNVQACKGLEVRSRRNG